MNKTTLRSIDGLLLDNTKIKSLFSMRIPSSKDRGGRLWVRRTMNVDTTGDNQAEDLLSGPQRLGLEDCRDGNNTILVRHTHRRMFCTTFQLRNVSHNVNLRIPMMGLFAWGKITYVSVRCQESTKV
jgi:hypothetical protein